MEIKTKLCNPANYGGTRGSCQIEYIVIHYTSNLGDTAKNNADYFAREALSYKASAHFFVDESEIWSSVPTWRIAYHCGAKTYKHPHCRNTNSIGVEICMLDKHAVIRKDAIRNAAGLVRELMTKYDIDADHVIRHYDVTGKDCPAPMVDDPGLWEQFLDMLEQEDGEEMKVYKYVSEMPEFAQDTFARLVQAGYVAKDKNGEIAVQECSLQSIVYLDRLTGNRLEKLPEILKKIGV